MAVELQIRKKGNKNFFHYFESQVYSASDLTAEFDGTKFKLKKESGAPVFLIKGFETNTVAVYDDTMGGVEELFTDPVVLAQRLITLGYTAFAQDGGEVISSPEGYVVNGTMAGGDLNIVIGDDEGNGNSSLININDVLGLITIKANTRINLSTQGLLHLRDNTTGREATIDFLNLSTNRALVIPNKDGTFAVTTDLDLIFTSGTGDLSIAGGNVVSLDGRYSLLGHTHTESDITDLQNYLLPTGNGSDLTNVDAETFDGLDSSSFLRSDEADTKTAGDLTLNDGISLRFGTLGGEARMLSDGSGTFFDLFNGDLKIRDDSGDRFTFGRTTGDFTATGTFTGKKLIVEPNARPTAFNVADNSTWGDIVVSNPTDTLNASAGIRFVVDATSRDSLTSGAGIVAVKDHASNNAYSLKFITDPDGGNPIVAATLNGAGDLILSKNLKVGSDIGTFDGISLGASSNRDFRIGQDSSHNLIMGWKYNAVAANAYSVVETFGGNNPLALQTSGGDVGIGTTTPSEKLDVNGSVKAIQYKSTTDVSTTTSNFDVTNTTGGTFKYTVSNQRAIVIGSFVADATGDLLIGTLPVGARPDNTRYIQVLDGGVMTIATNGDMTTPIDTGKTYILDFELTLNLNDV